MMPNNLPNISIKYISNVNHEYTYTMMPNNRPNISIKNISNINHEYIYTMMPNNPLVYLSNISLI